eukprot:CAMPEP_0201481664 /NCGR_PEP_ID=MMETSP0151_2-20130828/5933_1 /ASSEMBLY_ACC=CAM_ASM_000257 /TAXON_ID=200890 /ORGANISM="Paramoeba atlantica, Strain 621/1 / CCAP 1560/9" /LENGTH=248 /DNA_ID=CAMNT_0047863979 /DNA_START=52 /DNA_END=798 /DNA_ORIENTATION=-
MSEDAQREYSLRQLNAQAFTKPPTEVPHLSFCGGLFLGFETLAPYTHLRNLDFVAMVPSLRTLEIPSDLPSLCFPHLVQLNLNDNALVSLPSAFSSIFPGLRKLEICNNRLGSDVSGDTQQQVERVLEPLRGCAQLEILDLDENPLASLPGFREAVWSFLPSLSVLNWKDRENHDVADSDGESTSSSSDVGSDEEDDTTTEDDMGSSESSSKESVIVDDTESEESDEEKSEEGSDDNSPKVKKLRLDE